MSWPATPANGDIRRASDWLEVRGNGPGDTLLGWITGIATEQMTPGTFELYAAPPDEDLEYVEETPEGGARVRVSEIGELVELAVREHAWSCPRHEDLSVIRQHAPTYASRSVDHDRGTAHYAWPALAVSAREAEFLFDFAAFEPYDLVPHGDDKRMLDAERAFFDGFHSGGVIDGSTIAAGTITASKIVAGSIKAASIDTAKLASIVSTVKVVSGLPDPDDHKAGEIVFDSATNKLFRHDGKEWVTISPAATGLGVMSATPSVTIKSESAKIADTLAAIGATTGAQAKAIARSLALPPNTFRRRWGASR